MLDEPTNHLDKPTQRWFEQFLLDSQMTLLIISHDTAFLDRVVTHIWELRHHKIEEYRGNYSSFIEIRAERDANARLPPGGRPKRWRESKHLSIVSATRRTKPARSNHASSNLRRSR